MTGTSGAPLLVELFTEELPPKALQRLGEAFAHGLRDELAAGGLLAANCTTEIFATPRRLAALLSNVLSKAPDRQTEERLLPEKVGLDAAGKPTAALLKKLATLGCDESAVSAIKKASDGKLVMLFLPHLAAGLTLQAGLLAALAKAIARLPILKVMSYQLQNNDGSTETVKFVRPAHGLVALHGADVIDVRALGLAAGRITHGHRFLGARDIALKTAGEYEARLLNDGKVIASFNARRAEIDAQLKARAAELGSTLGEYAALLDEVTALVEWPVVYVAGFDAEFLSVPQECLILTMRTNQKYFPLFDKAGKLTERFLVVSNMQVADPTNIIEGNKRVVRPRLADARFFYDQDRKVKLAERVAKLASMVYHNKIGNQYHRVLCIQEIAARIAELLGEDNESAKRAAYLAKADLTTDMVGEFPELQGVMGMYYALHDGETNEIAKAIEAHYHPRFAGDSIPDGRLAQTVALADKLHTLVAIFGVGQIPTGDKDPFALRRAALGIVRMLIEGGLPLDIGRLLVVSQDALTSEELIEQSMKPPSSQGIGANRTIGTGYSIPVLDQKAISQIPSFIEERLKGYLRDKDYTPDEIEAVVSQQHPRIDLLIPRLEAVRAFRKLPEAEALASADKRIRNILSKSGVTSVAVTADESKLIENEEKQLLSKTRLLHKQVEPLLDEAKFGEALLLTAQLHQPVTQFFDKVMVNVEDTALRDNRFALLHEVANLTNRVANISKLAT